jgi:hypothetical protein
MRVETNDSRPTIRQSLMAIKAPNYGLIWSVLPIFVIKAESRPQPMPVLLLVIATTITSIAVLSNYRGIGNFCEVLTIVLLVPLVLSKWLFRARTD